MHMNDNCTVILPTYDEEANIGKMIDCLRKLYPDFHIIVMDDNSTDSTKQIVEDIMKKDEKVRIITRDVNDRGLSASIFQGIMETNTEFFINMDSDFQHPLSALKGIYEKLEKGSDLVVGVRRDRTALSSFSRWVGSWAAHMLAVFTLKMHGKKTTKDVMSGLFGGKTELFQNVIREFHSNFEMRGFKALFDLMKYAPDHIDISEEMFEFGERQGGKSKISTNIVFSILRQCDGWGRFLARLGSKLKS